MKRRLFILGVVVAAVVGVVWLKQNRANPTGSEDAKPGAHTSVLLFADPREADSSCGCGEVIRIARQANEFPGVAFQWFDPRKDSGAAKQHKVKASPTVLIVGADGTERGRFEGETSEVIDELRSAITALDTARTTTARP